ncbi:hypothetical protein [Natronospora cellulosivora (SeqCode)]
MGGKINVESSGINQGTRFIVSIPTNS